MPNHIEWCHAGSRPHGVTAAELAELDEGGNAEGFIGLTDDGIMLYGTPRNILDWLETAVHEVGRVAALERVRKREEAERVIRAGLSRDDEVACGSEFDDKVAVIRNLNDDSIGGDDPPNEEYRRGQLELLMDTTAWNRDMRPEVEGVYLYIFGVEMP